MLDWAIASCGRPRPFNTYCVTWYVICITVYRLRSAQPTKGWTRLHNFGKDWNEVNRHYEIVILDGMLPNLQVTTVSTSVDANSYAVVFFVRFVSF